MTLVNLIIFGYFSPIFYSLLFISWYSTIHHFVLFNSLIINWLEC